MLIIHIFSVKPRQIRKSCLEIFTSRLKHQRPGHFLKYVSVPYYSANPALRHKASGQFPTTRGNTGRYTYESFSDYELRFFDIVSSKRQRLHGYRQLSRTFQPLRHFGSRIIPTLLHNHQDTSSVFHALRQPLRTYAL